MALAADFRRALRADSIVAWTDDHVTKNELGVPFALAPHQREILATALAFDRDGRVPFDVVVYSCPKKEGKTTLNALVTLWWGMTQEPPNELIVVANDREQAEGRAFETIKGFLRHNPEIDPGADPRAHEIRLSNGTVIKAIGNEYAGEAGVNMGLTSWDELWGAVSESNRRLYEELTPVPTRKNSIRFISTYAGWVGESQLLWELYLQGVGPEEHPQGQGERVAGAWPVYVNRTARLCVYWDHEARMPWHTEAYDAAQKRTLRAGTYLRLHRNQWISAENIFITEALWEPCVDRTYTPPAPSKRIEVFAGVDASVKHDSAAVVAVTVEGNQVRLVRHRIWQPTAEQPLDLEDTIEAYLLQLRDEFRVGYALADPFQMQRSLVTLRKARVLIEEFPQSAGNLTRMGQQLFDLLNGRRLRMYPAEDLRTQALNTVAVEHPRGWRIAKEKTSKKIDSIVALAMACVAAVEAQASARTRWVPVGFNVGA